MNKKFYLPITISLAVLALMIFPDFVFAAGDYGLTATAQTAGLAGQSDLPTIVGNLIGTALSMISVLFFALILYGGFLWMTSRGNSDQEKTAKDTIFGAVVGIIIILAAYAITSFVFTNLGSGAGGGGAPSSGGGGGNGSSCTSDSSCSSGLYCTTMKTCTPKEKIGDPCYTNNACSTGLYCTPNGICSDKGVVGDICSSNLSCKSGKCEQKGNDKFCVASTAKKPTENKATPENASIHVKGESCKLDVDCLKGLSCINKVCDTTGSNQTSSVAEGGDCKVSSVCQSGLSCELGKCAAPKKLEKTSVSKSGEGTVCSSNINCNIGLLCLGDGNTKICQKYKTQGESCSKLKPCEPSLTCGNITGVGLGGDICF